MSTQMEIKRVLQKIGGIIRITKFGQEPLTYCIEDLLYTNQLTIGQLFIAVSEYYGKTKKSYSNFPTFRNYKNEISEKYLDIKNDFKSLKNDLEKLQYVCSYLNEPEIPVIPLETVLKNIEIYKSEKSFV